MADRTKDESETGCMLTVEVVYALPDRQSLLRLQVPSGASVAEAVRRSGILARHPEVDPAVNGVGIFGRLVAPDHELRDGDRIELYRPLLADPKDVRKRRARKR